MKQRQIKEKTITRRTQSDKNKNTTIGGCHGGTSSLPTPPAEARQKQRSQDALQNTPSPKLRRWTCGPRHGEEAKPRKDELMAAEG